MVEGPGCTRNGKKASALIGHSVTGCAGRSASAVSQAVRSRVLVDVATLGKQLWLFFGAVTDPSDASSAMAVVRVHFGMNGSLIVDGSPQHPKALTLLLCFGGHALRIFESTVSLADAEIARESIRSKQACARAHDTLCGLVLQHFSPVQHTC